jgi:uncharacterized protein (TIGR03435 family)
MEFLRPTAPAVLIFAALAAFAQAQPGRPTYEAASIKINDSGSNSSSSNGSKGQIVITNDPLHRLIERAFDVRPYQVIGPQWLETVRFDIVAKYPPEIDNPARILMMRSLLEDRFKMAIHRETRDLPGYALVVAKGGFKLKPVEAGGSSTSSNGQGRVNDFTATKTSMDELAAYVANSMREVVVDKTGIDGAYDFQLHWTRDDQVSAGADASPSNPLPTLPMALQDVLGLRLQPQKVPVEVIVVDHIERTPIEN